VRSRSRRSRPASCSTTQSVAPRGLSTTATPIGARASPGTADAASTGGDGGRVGQPAGDAEADQGEAGDSPNAQETDGIEAGARSAQHDLSAGQLTAPGDATGGHGSLPATPGAVPTADPTGAPGAGDGETGTTPADDVAPYPGAAVFSEAGAAESPTDTSGGTGASHGVGTGEGEQPSGRSAAAGASSGGAEGTAAVAADVPIVPL